MKKYLSLGLAFCLIIALCGCGNDVTDPTTTKTFSLNELSPSGGYSLSTEAMTCQVLVTEQSEYILYSNSERTMICYVDQDELLLLDDSEGLTTYYTENTTEQTMDFTHPLENLWEELKELDFTYQSSENGKDIYSAVTINQVTDQEQIPYIMYVIDMTWTDGENYTFSYYVYDDGATLISAEAPDEINPLLNSETKWKIDLDTMSIINTETQQNIPFSISSTTTGEAISPDGSNTVISEQTIETILYYDPTVSKVTAIQYVNDGVDGSQIEVLYEAAFEKPEITAQMEEMDTTSAQYLIMLASLLDNLL